MLLHHRSLNFLAFFLILLHLSPSTPIECFQNLPHGVPPIEIPAFTSQCLTIIQHLPNAPINFDRQASIPNTQANAACRSPSVPFFPRASFLHDRCIVHISIFFNIDDDTPPSEHDVMLAWAAARQRVRTIVHHCAEVQALPGGKESVWLPGTSMNWYIHAMPAAESEVWQGFAQLNLQRAQQALSGEFVSLVDLFGTALFVV